MAIDPDVQVLLDQFEARLDAVTPVRTTGGDDWQMLTDLHAELSSGDLPGTMRLEGRFRLSDMLELSGVHVDAAAARFDIDNGVPVGLRIGSLTGQSQFLILDLPSVFGTDSTGIGIHLASPYGCLIGGVFVERFDVGVLWGDTDQPCAYNTMSVRRLANNVNMDLVGSGSGWTNQNEISGGSWISWPTPTLHMRIRNVQGLLVRHAVFEGDLPQKVDVDNGDWIKFDQCSWERAGGITFRNRSWYNLIVGGPYAEDLEITESADSKHNKLVTGVDI